MGRARRSGFSLVLVLLALAGLAVATPARQIVAVDAAAVGWPPATLLVSEIATGGASASDEFVELVNAGPDTVDLAGLEVVYVTSSGSTVTQKASWTGSRPLDPGRHILLANAAGSYAPIGDATYAGGFAATGGAVALRVAGGSTIDAVGWGDATNAFVEGTAAPAPPAGSSLERLPGGAAGNATDTNDNAADWLVQASPSPQNLASAPSATLAPTPTPTPIATSTPGPTPSTAPSVSATPGVCVPPASPSPTASSSPSAIPSTPTPSPTQAPTPTPSPTPTPTATLAPTAIVDARAMPVGGTVHVRGVVTAEAGRLGSVALLVIADESAGIVVRLATGAVGPVRGSVIEVDGKLAAPYGQLEIRPSVGGTVALGPGTPPGPLQILATDIGEGVEGGLVTIEVVIDRAAHRETNGGLTLDALDPTTGGRVAIRADASSGIATSDLPRHARARLVGVVGQRATRTGRLDGYRIWLRDRADIVVTDPGGGSPAPSGSAAPSGSVTPGASTPIVSVAQALLSPGATVRVVGTVTAAGRLLDSSGRVVVVQDATAAIAVRLPTDVATPRVGVRLRVDGSVGRSYDAPRIAATAAATIGTGAAVLPMVIRTSPGPAHEWRLVRLEGIVAEVHKLGDRWRAEIAIGSVRVLVTGLPDSRLPASALVEGRRATIIGIVRRPYPTATDRRFAIVPRSAGDVRLGAAAGPQGAGDPAAGSGTGTSAGSGTNGTGGQGSGVAEPLDVDLATLAEHRGEVVRVGGIVTAVEPPAILLDDGTGVGRIVLRGDAATFLGLLASGDALDAVGRVGGASPAVEIEVTSASGIVRVGDPGPEPSGLAASDPADSAPIAHLRAGEGQAAPLDPEPARPAALVGALAGCVALAALVAGAFAVRRRRDRTVTSGRIAVRLAAIAGGRPDEPGSVSSASEQGA